MRALNQSTGSGFAIAGRRLVTNAHCVDHHTQVKVRRRGDDVKYVARVLAVGTECDLAVLSVEDDAFWEGLTPLCFGALPRLHSSVTVVGYPLGGDTISVTSGVVSRIEVTAYAHGATELLGVQIDAAINSGNSGGPAFSSQGECVGVAFQSLKAEDAENIGYVIPAAVVEHFLTDVDRNGKYTGFPALGIEWQRLESPFLRESLGMKPKQKGVLVRRVEPTGACAEYLQAGDVIMSFDGVHVANDGTVPFRKKEHERISFSYLISCKYNGETARLEVLRSGEGGRARKLTVDVSLGGLVRPVPVHIKGQLPSYFIVGGLVFTRVTVPYLRSEYGKEYEYDAPVKLLDRMMNSMTKTPAEQLVVLGQVLASELMLGYEDIANTAVLRFNGELVVNLAHLAEMVDSCTERYLTFERQRTQTESHTNTQRGSTGGAPRAWPMVPLRLQRRRCCRRRCARGCPRASGAAAPPPRGAAPLRTPLAAWRAFEGARFGIVAPSGGINTTSLGKYEPLP